MENAYFIDLWCCLALLKLRQTAPCFCCLLHILICTSGGPVRAAYAKKFEQQEGNPERQGKDSLLETRSPVASRE